ncbi:hypothetical protein DSUL_50344 [Desulfovibrionales bacterium]
MRETAIRPINFLLFMILYRCLFTEIVLASTLINQDNQQYRIAVFWDNMESPYKGTINPGQRIFLDNGTCTIELVGMHDNIYVHNNDTVIIHNKILRRR